jgi:hypothetical protein
MSGYTIEYERDARRIAAAINRIYANSLQFWIHERYPDGTPDPLGWPWGIVKRTRYIDRPDLGWSGGGFVWNPADMAGLIETPAQDVCGRVGIATLRARGQA